MKEVLRARLPAELQSADLRQALDVYQRGWGFTLQQHIPGVFAVLRRESVTVHLSQRRSDEPLSLLACRLLVDRVDDWTTLVSAPGQSRQRLTAQGWGREFGLSDGDGNRLLLVQSAPHAIRRRARV